MGAQLNPPSAQTAGQDAPTVASARLNGGVSIPCREVLVQASNTNTAWCYVGTSLAQVIELPPGTAISLPIDDVAKVYHTAASGTQLLNWIASQN
jgi:hypothetical protein